MLVPQAHAAGRERQEYATVKGKGVHLVVWRTFRPDDPPVNGETIDHIDRDEANNANAQPAPRHRVGAKAQPGPAVGRRPSASAHARAGVEGRRVEGGDGRALRRPARSGARAQRAVWDDQVYAERHWQAARAKSGPGKHNHWRFAFVPETDEEVAAREAQRARVLAAIAALRAEEGESEEAEGAGDDDDVEMSPFEFSSDEDD